MHDWQPIQREHMTVYQFHMSTSALITFAGSKPLYAFRIIAHSLGNLHGGERCHILFDESAVTLACSLMPAPFYSTISCCHCTSAEPCQVQRVMAAADSTSSSASVIRGAESR